MEKWKITVIEFESHARQALAEFIEKYPAYEKMIEARINDLLNYPDLTWQTVFIESETIGVFYTKNQQIELAGKAYKIQKRVTITHFSFHH